MALGMTSAPSAGRLRPTAWVGYAACAWMFVFAAMSFYWGAALSFDWPTAATVGLDTQSEQIKDLAAAREPWFIASLWITGFLKVIGGLLALALVRPSGRLVPRWMLLIAGWGVGVGMALYGGLGMIADGLRAGGALENTGSSAVWWHLLLWDPWWLLGGLLFVAAAWHAQRGARGPHRAARPSLHQSEAQSHRSPSAPRN
jgi:hypothetical protein